MAINTTSFNLTPQATDDAFLYTSLTEDSLTTTTLDVMANDLGGNAKTLYSLDNGIEDEGSATSADLLTKDIVGAANTSYNGATISITTDGKVSYNASTLSAAFKDQLQHLGAGQYLDDTFTYAIRLANGTLSWATASVRIYGVNDAAVIGGATTGSVSEDVAVAADHISTSGALTITDVDTGQDHFQTQASTAGSNGYGVFTLTADGHWTYSADNTQTAIQQLGDGESLTDSFTAVSADGTTKVVTVTIHGTNDAPVLTIADTSANVAEDGTVTDTGALSFTDVDIHDTHTVAAAYNHDASWTGGALSAAQESAITAGFTADSDSWDYAVANSALQFLGGGETITLSFDVTVSDNHGGSDTETVTVTITGANDAPVVSGDVTDSVLEGGASSTLDALANATDADQTDTLTVTDLPGTLPAGVTYDALTHSFTLDPTDGAYDHLADGDHTTVSVTYSVSDGLTSTPATVSWTVTGTNDAPVVSGDVTDSVLEGGSSSTLDALANASDVDDGTTLSVTDVPGTLPDGVTYDALTHSFTLDPTNGAYDHLADGDHTTVSVTYSVSDGLTSTPATVSWTVTGTNDAPVVTGDVTDSVLEGGSSSTLDALANASDVDDGTTLSVTGVPLTLPDGVTYDALTHSFTLDPTDGAYDHLADGDHTTVSVTYSVSDGLTSTPATVSWTVTGTNDAPVVSGDVTDSVLEGGSSSTLDALANASDVDDGTTLSVTDVPGTLPDGVTYDALTHSFTLDPTDGAYDHLADGDHTTVSVTYSLSDGLTSTPATVSWTVTGTNDAPVITEGTSDLSPTGDEDTLITGAVHATDVDDGDTLTFSVVNSGTGAPAHGTVSIDANTGAYSYAPAANYNGSDSFTVTVTDSHNVTDTVVVNVGVTPVNDAPVINELTSSLSPSGNEDATITGTIVATDVDGDSLTYSAPAQGDPNGPVHGSVSFDSAGGYTYTPDANYNGADSFTVTVSDSHGGTDTVGVSVTVNPVNDAPVLSDPTDITYTDTSATDDFTGVTGSLSASDIDNATLSYSLTGSAADASLAGYNVSKVSTYGTMYLNTATGAYHFEPNDAAINGLAAGSNPTVDFEFTASDGSAASNAQTLTVHLTGADEAVVVNPNAPDAVNDLLLISSGSTAATFSAAALLGNDTDPNSDTLHIVSVSGTGVSYDAVHQTIAYTTGVAGSFTYTVDDGHGNTDTATVQVQVVTPTSAGSSDTYSLSSMTYQGSYIDAGAGTDSITGGAGYDTFLGGNGSDTLVGGASDDRLIGGNGVDSMTGNGGADTFVFAATVDSPSGSADTITDFAHGVDKIDVSAIDAVSGGSDNAFAFVAADTNGAVANSITWHYDSGTNTTHIFGDTNGSGGAEFEAVLTGHITLTSGDFIL